MYVRCNPNRKNVKYLSYVEGYRDENGVSRQKTIRKIGDWEELKKLYDDPIGHFNQLAKDEKVPDISITLDTTESLGLVNDHKNFGYCILQQLYNQLDISSISKHMQKKYKISFDIDEVLKLLVYSRILYPGSKNSTFKNKDRFFENFDFNLWQMYRSLDYIPKYKDDFLKQIWDNSKDTYNRDNSTTYYDCTNYYFEISYNDEDLIDEEGNILEKGLRKKGVSKEHRKTPIVQMGLLMDKTGIPLNYGIFSGNESEKTSLLPLLKETKKTFGMERTILVADRGLNTSDNTYKLTGKNDESTKHFDGYVYGQSIRGGSAEFKKWVLNQDDYITDTHTDETGATITFKHKSRIFGKDVNINTSKGKAKDLTYQKQMVYYSEKYARKSLKERELMLEKAKHLISNPGAFTRANTHGVKKYINNLAFIKETGEIANGADLSINLTLLEEEALYDGYYCIVTSETELCDKEIRDIYRGLWKIEESFKVTKSTLETRPVYVWTKEHIEAHFLTCFMSLVLIRLLEKELGGKYSPQRIADSLKSYTCTKEAHDVYKFAYRDEVIVDFEQIYGINLNLKYQKYINMKKILDSSKTTKNHNK